MHYLDHAATTPVPREVAETMASVLTEHFGNPSAQYGPGREARDIVERGRAVLARALECRPEQVVFTSCGTEGDNWAIRAALYQNRRTGKHIVTTAVEHSAVLQCVKQLEREGYTATYVKPDGEGRVSAQSVLAAVREDTALVSVMLVNNETGAVLPVSEIAAGLRDRPALLHTDAVQGFLKVPCTARGLGADYITLSAHKIGGPKGIGALYIGGQAKNALPLLFGGGQESGLRPGTEATHQTAAFAAAVRSWQPGTANAIRELRDYAAGQLATIAGVSLITDISTAAPHILALSLPDFSGQTVVEALGSQGVCVSSGSACHRGKPSHVFAAMPIPEKVKYGAVRVSFGPKSTQEEVDVLVRLIRHICEKKSLLF